MAEVVWRRAALDDLRGIIRYINQFDEEAAQRTGLRLYELGESLCDFPARGRVAGDGNREMTSVAPYVLRYAIESDQVVILAIRHGRQQVADTVP